MPTLPPSPATWSHRISWLLLPVVAGPAIADAFADSGRSVQVVSALLAWSVWGSGLAASLVPRAVTLTTIRLVTPGAVALSGWAALGAERPAWAAAGLVVSLISLLAVLSPSVADAFVDGSSYGDERRVSLRAPASLAVGPIPVAWSLLAASAVTGPLLLATERWVAGAVASVAGAVVAGVLAARFHVLSRRWLVFVPAGVVVHDPLTLTQPVLVPRHLVRRFGPAPADGDSLDLSGGALGLALELRTREPISVEVRRGRRSTEHSGVAGLVVTPGRPAAALEVADERRLPVS